MRNKKNINPDLYNEISASPHCNQIRTYLINSFNDRDHCLIDKSVLEEHKMRIQIKEKNEKLNYIDQLITNDINRHIVNITKNNFNVDKLNIDNLVMYLVMTDNPFIESIQKIIDNDLNVTCFHWIEDFEDSDLINAFILQTIEYIHLCELVNMDIRMNQAKKENIVKINNAMATLLEFTNDEQVKHYIGTITNIKQAFTETTLHSCIFCGLFHSLLEVYPNKNEAFVLDIANDIMKIVFQSEKYYRKHKFIQDINYKGYTLKKFQDKRER